MSVADESLVPLRVDVTLRGAVIAFRVLGLAWMAMLVAVTLANRPDVDAMIAVGALALATVWTIVTIVAARDPRDPMRSVAFVATDGAVALLVASASFVTGDGTHNVFHGGYPMSWVIVAAYAGGMTWAIGAALLLFAHQVAMYVIEGTRDTVATVGNIVFIVFAIVMGWAVDALRSSERARIEADEKVAAAMAEKARHEERANLANQLHDSYLQTLVVIGRDADDADEVRYLARRQARELRRVIDTMRSEYGESYAASLLAIRDEVEDLFRIEIHVVIRDDAELTESLRAAAEAGREAMTNAAKHAGVDEIDVYSEINDGTAALFVRDRGRGFDSASSGGGLDHSLRNRVESVGGTVDISSTPGGGTEVVIKVRSAT